MEDGALLVAEGRILAVGARRAVQAHAPSGTEVVDFGEAVLLPPLANAHTHLELTDFPQWAAEAGEGAAPESFVGWIQQVIRVKRQVSAGRFAPSVQRGIAACLAAGTGAIGDILSFLPGRELHAASPLRGRLFLETLGRDPLLYRNLLHTLRQLLQEQTVGHLQLGLSPHSLYTLSKQHLDEALRLVHQRQLPLTIHLGESPAERSFLAESAGEIAEKLYPYVGWKGMVPPPARRSPVACLAEAGGLLPGILLAHGVQVDADDVELLARSGAAVVLCPRSNARLGVGKAPVSLYRQACVPLALGTDSRASCDSLSVWDELAFAVRWFADTLTPTQWLTVATAGGAQALGLEGEMGRLTAGSGAHFQLLTPTTLPNLGELEEFLCAPGRSADVRHLFLGGQEVWSQSPTG